MSALRSHGLIMFLGRVIYAENKSKRGRLCDFVTVLLLISQRLVV